MELIKVNNKSHWYDKQGNPVHEVPCKSKDGMRPTTVKDARELGLVPSVTNILGILNKKGLNEWRVEQGILSALTLPRLEGEDDQSFAHRVVEDMQQQSEQAMEFGSKVHAFIEGIINIVSEAIEFPEIENYLLPVCRFLVDNNFSGKSEQRFATNEYAGTIDFIGSAFGEENVIVDFKTQATKQCKKVIYYDEWVYQLVAYYNLIPSKNKESLYSVVISSSEPGRIEFKEWSLDEQINGEAIFNSALKIFKLQRGL